MRAPDHPGASRQELPDPTQLTVALTQREVTAVRDLLMARINAIESAIAVSHEDMVRVPTEVDKQITHLKALHEVKIQSCLTEISMIRQIIETRLTALDRAVHLVQDLTDLLPKKIDEKIAALAAVHEERFTAVQGVFTEKFASTTVQFRERDVRTEQSSKDSKDGIEKALQAAKEAVAEQNKSSALSIAKSEAATTKQIDQLGVLIGATSKAADEKIADLKDRLMRIEGSQEAIQVAGAEHRVERRAATGNNQWVIGVVITGLLAVASLAISLEAALR